MKYYLITIQYNAEAKAENRPVPKMYEDFNKAQADFYTQVGKDMNNAKIGGSLNMVVNEVGGTYPELTKQWGFMHEEEIVEDTIEEIVDEDESVEVIPKTEE